MQLLTPRNWQEYQLIDSGNFEKLERFGQYILIRPEPQAVWDKKISNKEWEQQAHVKFNQNTNASGFWKKLKTMPEQWKINYPLNNTPSNSLVFRLGLTAFKHVGIFPEQAENWEYIYACLKRMKTPKPKVLNLFAYTGGASLAAKAAGADLSHVDSIKQVISWAKENMELSKLTDIRWVVEDALKFVKRELKRGNTYNGIILDPPAYGHGPAGEKWKLEDDINEMIQAVIGLLNKEEHFLILNAYSLGFSSIIIENLLFDAAKTNNAALQTGELCPVEWAPGAKTLGKK